MLNFVNRWFLHSSGGLSRPVFHQIDRVCPELRKLEQHCGMIREELEQVLPQQHAIPRYHEADSGRSHISSGDNPQRSWRVFMLYLMGEKPLKNRELCPKTSAMLDQILNLFQSFFSILEPHTPVPPHSAPYEGYLRYHLPIIIPTDVPPQLRVKAQMHTWREREGVLFDDTWDHEVFNESDFIRVVLVVDVLRPMPRIPDQ